MKTDTSGMAADIAGGLVHPLTWAAEEPLMVWNPIDNERWLRALYEGRRSGLALILEPGADPSDPGPGDVAAEPGDLQTWVDWYERDLERRIALHRAVEDDAVPYVRVFTGTGLFAQAFGCPLHHFPDSPPAARPIVTEAVDCLHLPQPDMETPCLARVLELAERLAAAMPGVPIGVPDIQSPFGIAAIIWNKEDFLLALLEEPTAVMDLVERCGALLRTFLDAFLERVPNVQMCHCPAMWVPPEYGMHCSEDEIGIIAPESFERFCLPQLSALSEHFGGLWMHCCADADHQYPGFERIPDLRGLNRRFFRGPEACIERFSDRAVFSMGWTPDEQLHAMLDAALPNSRFVFNLSGHTDPDQARRRLEGLRARMPRP
ncbi:MAG: uroporphyrinogen decarboxylase family protein, partial [Planctomycetota bacterium]